MSERYSDLTRTVAGGLQYRYTSYCLRCGACVADAVLHDAFHDLMEDTMSISIPTSPNWSEERSTE